MRFVSKGENGEVHIMYMWLPTWIGINAPLCEELEGVLQIFMGKILTEELLDEMHDKIVLTVAEKYPMFEGLDDYLNSLKFVREQDA